MDLENIEPGFKHEATDSQSVFRVALNALSYPGRLWTVEAESGLPGRGHAAAAKLMLGLLDDDCLVWLSSSLANSDVSSWLRFHTGCQFVRNIALADFVWVGEGDVMPLLESMNAGDDEYPDQSATCLIEVSEINTDDGGWYLQGPGIEVTQMLKVEKKPYDFDVQWSRNHSNFPRGVDIYFISANVIAGLPRTTQLQPARKE